MNGILTEVLPSSGVKACSHDYKMVESIQIEGKRRLTLVCSRCGDAKESFVAAPTKSKSDQKPLLCEG